MDTNALMMPVERNVRVFDELERVLGASPSSLDVVTPRAVVDELEKLRRHGGEEGTAASVGRDLAERCRIVDTGASYADDAVVELATTDDYVVTNDKPLRDRLLERGVRVIGLRGANELTITEP
jgi:hypothetical protein